jgi:fibro-slime domain-containing protein
MGSRPGYSRRAASFGAVVLALAAAGCSINARQGEVGVYLEAPDGGAGAAGAAGASMITPGSIVLNMTIHDFKVYDVNDPTTNPDFHNVECDRDIVARALGSDRKPVYQVHTYPLPTFGKAYFDQWYHDAPGTNISVTYPLTLTPTADGQKEYDSRKSGTVDTSNGAAHQIFMPIDDGTPYATAFGNQGSPHNYAFTGELHALFTYPGAGSLRFRSDDDMYVFINNELAINLGGIHGADNSGSALDLSGLGLTVGNEYPLDLFYAERWGKTGDILIVTPLELRSAN